jgi:flagellar motor protein MotB
MKSVFLLFCMTSILISYEDVSFSARTLGLGGEQAALTDDAFSTFVNPSLPARWTRPAVSLSGALASGTVFWSSTYVHSVKGLGAVGGNFFYRNFEDSSTGRVGDSDARFFLAVPIGRFLNLGAGIGAHSTVMDTSGEVSSTSERFASNAFFSLGGSLVNLKGVNIGLSFIETPIDFSGYPISNFGVSWAHHMKPTSFVSSMILAGNIEARENVKVHAGVESWFFKDCLGIRAGMRYGTDTVSGFSPTLGLTLRTHRLEKTDFELHYGLVLNYGTDANDGVLHQLSLAVLFGDARKAEKDSILAEQTERARRLREEALSRERDKLRSELEQIKNERSTLEKERKDIERLRKEKLDAISRLKGIQISETDSIIKITLFEQALAFDSMAADIPFPQGYKTLSTVAAFLANYPGKRILVEVHTDDTPIPDEMKDKFRDSKALTSARADNIRRYLVEVESIASSSVIAKGMGDTKPIADNSVPEERARNRRTEISVFK